MRPLLLLFLAGCIAQARASLDPPAAGGGTLSCREIAEQCDAQCTNPMCVRACGNQGTADAATLHNAVVDCAQRNNCLDEDCLHASCESEYQACRGPESTPAEEQSAPPPLEPTVQ